MAPRGTQGALLLAGVLLAAAVQAQDPQAPPANAATAAEVGDPPASSPPAGDARVTTLEEVRALKPEDEPLDLYRFKNPREVRGNRFNRDWSESPSLEQVGQSGGYVMMGINAALGAAAKGLHKISGGPDQVQPAVARPPPELSEEQRRRAQQYCEGQADCGP